MWTAVLAFLNVAGVVGVVLHLTGGAMPEPAVAWVVPMGDVERAHVVALADVLRARTHAVVQVGPRLDFPAGAYDPAQGRYLAEALMAEVMQGAPRDAWRVMVVTDVPLMSLDGDGEPQPVMGTGQARGRAAVISTYTLSLRSHSDASLQRRVADLMLHELGHTLGLHHCQVGGCVMSQSSGDSVVWTDMGRHDFCPLCRLKLADGILTPYPDDNPTHALAQHQP